MLPEHESEAPPPARRFCPRCGTPIPADADRCAPCAAAAPHPDATQPQAQVRAHLGAIRAALGVYFLLLLVSIIGAIVFVAIDGEPGSPTQAHTEAFQTAVFALVVIGLCLPARADLRPLLALPRPRWLLAAPPLALATWLVATGAVLLLQRLGADDVQYVEPFRNAGYPIATVFILISICPGIFEELSFRGVIQTRLTTALGPRDGLLVTALLFATIHLSPLSFPHLLLIGLVLGWLRARSGSLLPGMLMHACHNALVVAAEFWSS